VLGLFTEITISEFYLVISDN